MRERCGPPKRDGGGGGGRERGRERGSEREGEREAVWGGGGVEDVLICGHY